jgi:small-conductance mechanosensitive channel
MKVANNLTRALLIIMATVLVVSWYLGYLNPAIEFLNSERFSVKVGETTLSAYKIIKILISGIILIWLASEITSFAEKHIRKFNIRASNRGLILKAINIMVYIIAFLLMLDVLGIDLTAFTVIVGAIGIGIGFGLQKIASNFISGLILLFEKSVEGR